jgi:hypothetical protein
MNNFVMLEPIGRRRCNRFLVLALHLILMAVIVSTFIAGNAFS